MHPLHEFHPCAFFSCKFSPAKQNYDIGNWEQRAIRWCLKSGVTSLRVPMHIWSPPLGVPMESQTTEPPPGPVGSFLQAIWFHCYLPSRVQEHQSRCPLTYLCTSLHSKPKSILPFSAIMSPIQWTLDNILVETFIAEPTSQGAQMDPSSIRLTLMDSVHFSGHPGIYQTILLQQDQSCKSHHHLPAWKIILLSIPRHPWPQLGLDFLTDLPILKGFACVLEAVNPFSKMWHLVALKGRPTALEVLERVRKGVRTNLSSRYDPQTNSQMEREIQEFLAMNISTAGEEVSCHIQKGRPSTVVPWIEDLEGSWKARLF